MKSRKALLRLGKARLCPIHSKGILTLSLLILAESVTFSNAVTDLQLQHQRHNAFSFFQKKKSSTESDGNKKQRDEYCPNSSTVQGPSPAPVLSSVLSFPRTRLFAQSTIDAPLTSEVLSRQSDAYDGSLCCNHCKKCLHPDDAARICKRIPRGGHVASSTAADSASTLGVKSPYGIPLHLWKVLFQAVLTAINVFCWLVPLRSERISENKLAMSLANAFSGGVFLSLAFGHLIPECIHGFENMNHLPEAFPFLMVLAGYLLIFFVEKVAFDAHEILHELEHTNTNVVANENDKTRVLLTLPAQNGISKKHNSAADGHTSSNRGRGAVILLCALAVHSVLEMMALGLSDSFGDCALLTLSIALHQPAESIALLVAFLKSGMPKPQILQYLSIFSCMGPLGVALGMAVNEYAAPIVDSVILAIVAGTFVYVGATEVIPEEWEDSTHKWKKFAALMSGIVSILAITQYTMSLGIE